MKNTLTSVLNITSAFCCIIIGITLTTEIGFHLIDSYLSLFTKIHIALAIYFVLDILIRIIFSRHNIQSLLTHLTDLAVIVPILYYFTPQTLPVDGVLLSQLAFLVILVGRIPHMNFLLKLFRLKPAQIFIMGFFICIFVGTLLLSLPVAHVNQAEIPLTDALFIATSAICVTGLSTLDIGTQFTGFGQAVILILIQIGGLGMMTFSALFGLFLHKKFTQAEGKELLESYSSINLSETSNVIRSIIQVTFALEIIGAGILYILWNDQFESKLTAVYHAIFHAISAFCNAGFSLYSDSLARFALDAPTLLTISGLIIIGGLGFPVLYNLFTHRYTAMSLKHLKLQTKMTLTVSAGLLLFGTIVILIGEYNYALAPFGVGDKILTAFFQSVTARTAGFSTLELGTFRYGTLWLMMCLMFIGASPGSTGGGIKTTTFGLVVLAFLNTLQSRNRIEVFGRTITTDNIFRALSIIIISAIIITTGLYLLLYFEPLQNFFGLFFEAVSAFGTVGLSLGVTENLSKLGKLIIIPLMFIGRVGPLTIAFALSRTAVKPNYQYPEERIFIV